MTHEFTDTQALAKWRNRLRFWMPIADSGISVSIIKTEHLGYETALVGGDEPMIIDHHERLRDALFDAGTRVGYMLAKGGDTAAWVAQTSSLSNKEGAADEH